MKSTKININIADAKSDAHLICFNCKSLTENFYQRAGFFVLSKAVEIKNSVFIPDLRFSDTFWKELKKSKNLDFGGEFPLICEKEILDKISRIPYTNTEIQKAKQIASHFQKNWPEFLLVAKKVFGANLALNKIAQINIIITKYGTRGSFNLKCKREKNTMYLSARTDLPKEEIFSTLLMLFQKSITNSRSEPGEEEWHQQEAITNFLKTKTDFAKFMTSPTNTPTHKYLNYLSKLSRRYIKKLGFADNPNDIFLDSEEQIIVKGNVFDHFLTPQENTFLKTLLKNRGKIISFEKMGNKLWNGNSYDKFSLYSLAKIAQNVRQKIFDAGIKRNVIYTLRGRGYFFIE